MASKVDFGIGGRDLGLEAEIWATRRFKAGRQGAQKKKREKEKKKKFLLM